MVYHCRMQTAWKYEKGVDTMKNNGKSLGLWDSPSPF